MKFRFAGVIVLFVFFTNIAFAGLTDIKGYRFSDSINYLNVLGVVSGYPDGTFLPENPINRAELTKMVVEGFFMGPFDSYAADCFSDVKKEDWFSKYVCFAKKNLILDGYPDGSFGPGKDITQPEALKIIYNSLNADIPEIEGEWYDRYLDYSKNTEMYYFNTNSPADYVIKRGEISYFINWLINSNGSDQITKSEFYGEEAVSEYNYNYDSYNFYFSDFEFDETYATYLIDKNSIQLNSGVADPKHSEIWNYFSSLIPSKYRKNLVEYVVFTDGEGDALAMMDSWLYYDEAGVLYDEWVLNVDLVDAFKTNGTLFKDGEDISGLTYTLIHEFAHLLTLSLDQIYPVEWNTEAEYELAVKGCEGVFLREGCAYKDSYLTDFYNEFWTEIYDEWDKLQYISDDFKYYDELYKFYLKYKDQFVNDYAASDLGEDIAESFAYFVLREKPSGNSIFEKKMLFFYKYDEFVDIRDSVRKNI